MYQDFDPGIRATSTDVYEHEIPGGQYSNLRPQAVSLGLGDKMEEIKKAYVDVNELFGDIVKVTPSSKVVGDMALYMVSNKFTKEDIYNKGDAVNFPESVISFFKGDLGQPPGGFPAKLQKIVLKDIKPYTDLPNAHLQPVDFDNEFKKFQQQKGNDLKFTDFLSWKFYPKVFDEYLDFTKMYGDVSTLPTLAFFYGMSNNEELLVEIGKGKTIIIRLLYIGDIDENGHRTVYFRLNGQTRSIDVVDKKANVKKAANLKATSGDQIGTPLQGMLSRLFIKPGQKVLHNTPLFTIEAMKMETTITASRDLTIKQVILPEGTFVETDDAVLTVE